MFVVWIHKFISTCGANYLFGVLSLNLWILPVAVFGKSSTKRIPHGRLNLGSLPDKYSMSVPMTDSGVGGVDSKTVDAPNLKGNDILLPSPYAKNILLTEKQTSSEVMSSMFRA